jgi:energy-coupling factor transport system ATP-binding protein
MAMVELERVRYRYDDANAYALDDVNLKIAAGEFVLLAGASGSGKSTLCRLLNGLIPHFHGGALEGRVLVDGLDTCEHPVHELFARVGLVFQNPDAQLFNSTVDREIAFGLESLGLPRAEIRARVDWALRVARLESLRNRMPHTLSGGEQQTVALATILALRPRVLALDEPFTNLDSDATARFRQVLREIHAQGTTVILTEHRLHASLQDATRLIVLDHGHIVRDGAPSAILRDDVSAFRLNTASADNSRAMPRTDGLSSLEAHRNMTLAPLESARAIKTEALTFARAGREILREINFDVARGECVALIGKNGSGKTTLLKHLNALYTPTRGTVMVLNQDTRRARVSDLARHVGLVFQNPNDQLFKPNVREEIEVAPRALKRFDRVWMEKLLDEFELRQFLARSPFTLSEGEKKRVAFASALTAHPEIVALDEPTTGQDAVFRAALVRLLRDLQNQGITVILATHDLEFAAEVAPRWIVLADGEIVADGAPGQVIQNREAMTRAALHSTVQFSEWLVSTTALTQ